MRITRCKTIHSSSFRLMSIFSQNHFRMLKLCFFEHGWDAVETLAQAGFGKTPLHPPGPSPCCHGVHSSSESSVSFPGADNRPQMHESWSSGSETWKKQNICCKKEASTKHRSNGKCHKVREISRMGHKHVEWAQEEPAPKNNSTLVKIAKISHG